MNKAIEDVIAERKKQDSKWGPPDHDPFCFLTILMEEVGELSQAALHACYGGPQANNMRAEAVQVAAVAISIIECLDKSEWTWGQHALKPLEAEPPKPPDPADELSKALLELVGIAAKTTDMETRNVLYSLVDKKRDFLEALLEPEAEDENTED